MSAEPLPWPAKPTTDYAIREYEADWAEYYEARADAAMSRLRIAVEALESVGSSLGCKYGDGAVSISELLAIIGPLPPETGKA